MADTTKSKPLDIILSFRFPGAVDPWSAKKIALSAADKTVESLDVVGLYFSTLTVKVAFECETNGAVEAQVDYENGDHPRDTAFHVETCKSLSRNLRAALSEAEYKDLKVFIPVGTSAARCTGVL